MVLTFIHVCCLFSIRALAARPMTRYGRVMRRVPRRAPAAAALSFREAFAAAGATSQNWLGLLRRQDAVHRLTALRRIPCRTAARTRASALHHRLTFYWCVKVTHSVYPDLKQSDSPVIDKELSHEFP